ncbi:MAG: helix-turn-helix domain-containing protein [Halocynthiibacter sp.]
MTLQAKPEWARVLEKALAMKGRGSGFFKAAHERRTVERHTTLAFALILCGMRILSGGKAARLRADLTQTELAALLVRSQSFVAKYENGERRGGVVEFVHIVRALGCEGTKLFKDISGAELGGPVRCVLETRAGWTFTAYRVPPVLYIKADLG